MYKASVVIPTYNGVHKIVNALKSLEHQTYSDFETIVVIDGSTDATLEVLNQTSYHLTSMNIIVQENGGRSKVRNRGVRESESEIIIFMDDDMRFTPEVVEQHLRHHQSYANSILAGIPIEDPSRTKNDIQSYKRHLSLNWIEKFDKGLNKLDEKNLFLTTANMSMSKKLFLQLGGFDESLTDAEDKKLGLKALELGVDLFLDKNIIGWHDDFITCRSYIMRRREYERAQMAANLGTPISKFKKLIYFPFAQKYLVRLIDKNYFINFLPRIIRYRFYTLVIWGLSRYYPNRKN